LRTETSEEEVVSDLGFLGEEQTSEAGSVFTKHCRAKSVEKSQTLRQY
jgi:hypothetical protein